jgi:hypothetical protein
VFEIGDRAHNMMILNQFLPHDVALLRRTLSNDVYRPMRLEVTQSEESSKPLCQRYVSLRIEESCFEPSILFC